MGIFEEEKKHLDYVLDSIDVQRKKISKQIEDYKDESAHLSFEDKKRGAHFDLNGKLEYYGQNLYNLEKARPNPYFGRIDFVPDNGGEIKIYIGKLGISNDSNSLVTDWRAPICSLYYDSELGKVSYESINGTQSGDLVLKRQINIKDSQLIDVNDTNLVTNDELLRPYLNNNADNKMKDIVATIQKEQNNIIRMPLNKNVIVQGVAGSGKTSVALHRIAYLIYNLSSIIKPEMFLVIGPNDYFLNYISTLLPELDTSPVEQKTIITLFKNYIDEKISVKNQDAFDLNDETKYIGEKIEGYKASLEFKEALDKFLVDYFNNELIKDDFVVEGEIIFSKDLIKRLVFLNNDGLPNFKRCSDYLKKSLKNESQEIFSKINEKYRNIYINLPKGHPDRIAAVNRSEEIYRTLKKDGIKLFLKYMKEIDESALKIYTNFISNVEKYAKDLSEKEILYLKKNTLTNLKKHSCSFVDIPALMHIKHMKTGKKLEYKYIIIDEAQDFGLFHFDILKNITKNATFSIYGDLAQSIYSYRGIKSWKDVYNYIFNESNCEFLQLSKSYRTTIEITENANNILEYLNLKTALPVIRHGEVTSYFDAAKDNGFKISKIKELIDKGYQTIAVICKTDKEVVDVEKLLKAVDLNVKVLSSDDKEYSGGLFVLTSAASKGLEFDAVIINDASEKVYSSFSDVDMHLLYVASTRALHEQVILYNRALTKVYKKFEQLSRNKEDVRKLVYKK